jgi:hypothetical protein
LFFDERRFRLFGCDVANFRFPSFYSALSQVDINTALDEESRTILMLLISSSDDRDDRVREMMSILLSCERLLITTADSEGNTALHHWVPIFFCFFPRRRCRATILTCQYMCVVFALHAPFR